MKSDKYLKTIGYITKLEQITTVEHNIIEGTLVLENSLPYPGYESTETVKHQDHNLHIQDSVFLVIVKNYNAEQIVRLTQRIKKYAPYPFDSVPGQLYINDESFSCLRLRHIKGYDDILTFQELYKDEGIRFIKKRKIQVEGMIKIQKFFQLETIQNGMYKDLEKTALPRMYFSIPKQLNWKLFEQITRKVKEKMAHPNFDAALVALHSEDGFLDLVRIWSNSDSPADIIPIRDLYFEEIMLYME